MTFARPLLSLLPCAATGARHRVPSPASRYIKDLASLASQHPTSISHHPTHFQQLNLFHHVVCRYDLFLGSLVTHVLLHFFFTISPSLQLFRSVHSPAIFILPSPFPLHLLSLTLEPLLCDAYPQATAPSFVEHYTL